jgi:hypothetical protein
MSAIIDIIIHTEYPSSPQVQRMVKKSNKNNATVILEWMQEDGVSYNVNVFPSPLASNLSGTMSQLVILYNTSYRADVVATLCGNNMNRTAIDFSFDQPGVFDNNINRSLLILAAIVLTSVSLRIL